MTNCSPKKMLMTNLFTHQDINADSEVSAFNSFKLPKFHVKFNHLQVYGFVQFESQFTTQDFRSFLNPPFI